MKHEKEIDELLRSIVYDSWMSEEEYNEIMNIALSELNMTKQKLSDDIEIGIKNGYPLEFQINLVKSYLLKMKDSSI